MLDALYEEILERLERGEHVLAGALVRGREDLLADAQRLLDLAERVSVVRPSGWPKVPGYAILGELGRGGMGAVYLARQERLGGRPVALKVLPPGFELSGRSHERFMQEARAVARLRHPNIVSIHDVVESPGACAFAMEWIDGASLSRLIDAVRERGGDGASVRVSRVLEARPGGGVDEVWPVYVARTGIAIARALEAVHSAGMLHRDVKPSNILIRRDGTALLTDFGLAREQGSAVHTVSGQFVGTPSYAAPEQLRGERTLDARTDVYGLGVTLYHALALRRAYEDDSIPKILARIEGGKVEQLRRVNPRLARDLETIVSTAMEPEPGRRYASAGALADDLERLVTLRPIRAKASGLATRVVKLVRRNRGRVVGGVIGGTLAVAAAILVVFLVYVAPRMHEQRVREARIALVGQGFMNGFFNRTYGGADHGKGEHNDLEDGQIAEALWVYDGAARLPVFGDRAIELERDVVRLGQELREHGSADAGAALRQRIPVTASYAERFDDQVGFPIVQDSELRSASPQDHRSLGLLGVLVGDYGLALAAWPLLDTEGGEDPVVELALGYMYVILDRPELAYPRLRSAAGAFPDVGFIHTLVADAAVRVGDYERAEQILARAERMAGHDPEAAFERVRLDLLCARGKHEEAEVYWRGIARTGNPLCVDRIAGSREARGKSEEAVLAMVSFPRVEDWRHAWRSLREGLMPRMRTFEVNLVGVCDRWWEGLGAEARSGFIAAASACEECYERYILERYATARARVTSWPAPAPLVMPGGEFSHPDLATGADEGVDSGGAVESLSLSGVCARLGVQGWASMDGTQPGRAFLWR